MFVQTYKPQWIASNGSIIEFLKSPTYGANNAQEASLVVVDGLFFSQMLKMAL